MNHYSEQEQRPSQREK